MSELKTIARIHTDFDTKFGIPRQSGVVAQLKGKIVFEPEFRNPDAVRGIEDWSHLWLIWEFSENKRETWSATVRPPRLGGNTHVGVFASRSPFRPNPIGLSCVKLDKIEYDKELGAVLCVSGADMLDGTPIYDIKPYVPYADSHPEASEGFTGKTAFRQLEVHIAPELEKKLDAESLEALRGVLCNDPRPSYHNDPERIYGFGFAGREVKFRVEENVLTVVQID